MNLPPWFRKLDGDPLMSDRPPRQPHLPPSPAPTFAAAVVEQVKRVAAVLMAGINAINRTKQ